MKKPDNIPYVTVYFINPEVPPLVGWVLEDTSETSLTLITDEHTEVVSWASIAHIRGPLPVVPSEACDHDWGDPSECDDDCGDDRCSVACRNCDTVEQACDD